jgi:hypothetical protein
VKLLNLLGGGDDQASSDRNTIKITGEQRAAYYGDVPPPPFECFTREGEKLSWIYTTGENDGVTSRRSKYPYDLLRAKFPHIVDEDVLSLSLSFFQQPLCCSGRA